MTVIELEKELEKIGVSKNLYSILEGGLPNEQLCLVKEDVWYVYYSERGRKTGLKSFEKESDACDYFYKKLKKYALI